ncbi:Replication factor A protein 2 [Dioscorea alata]|uniref:Replication factor A protein 2 n=1 Tax=Dioscorea alata TaxID=55571 RepID=A0ACB7WIK2_DIOAL|nr:Replication factor A protein 2 [Dioscorea alata]
MFAGAGAGALFDGGGFMPSQAPDPTSSPSKSRGGAQRLIPLTVKQIREAFDSSDDKYNLVVERSNVKLLGLVMNKVERVTDVSFTLDDGTGCIEISRWMNEIWDSNEMALIQNGMYVKVNGHLKGFQGKQCVVAFSVRPVVNFNDIALHFLECIHAHMDIAREKGQGGTPAQIHENLMMTMMRTPFPNVLNAYQVSLQHPGNSGVSGSSNDIYNLVLGVLQEPSSLACEHGLHIDEIVKRVGLPTTKIMEVINYHVDSGHIYSTIDENHFKSACTG